MAKKEMEWAWIRITRNDTFKDWQYKLKATWWQQYVYFVYKFNFNKQLCFHNVFL